MEPKRTFALSGVVESAMDAVFNAVVNSCGNDFRLLEDAAKFALTVTAVQAELETVKQTFTVREVQNVPWLYDIDRKEVPVSTLRLARAVQKIAEAAAECFSEEAETWLTENYQFYHARRPAPPGWAGNKSPYELLHEALSVAFFD